MYRPAEDRGAMPPSFVVELAALLALGPLAAAAVSLVAAAAKRRVASGIAAVAATAAAVLVYQALGGTVAAFEWPIQALPIAGAVAAYCLVRVVIAQVLTPIVTRRPIPRAWQMTLLRDSPTYFVGAALAVTIVELIEAQLWPVLAVAAGPVFFAFRAYIDYLTHVEDSHRRREVIDALDHGIAVIDRKGRVTLWGDSVERLVGGSPARVVGQPLVSAVPALRGTVLAKEIDASLADAKARTVRVIMNRNGASRTLDVKIVPIADGATLLWHDLTERLRSEQALKRDTERLSLAADGANDGLWEWDLRTDELYVSRRWRRMLGLDPAGNTMRVNDWFTRLHPEDVTPLQEALKALEAAETEEIESEVRLSHEDGSYRVFLCRAVGGGSGRRRSRIAGSLTDITDRINDQERLRTVGFRDPLTGLRNRTDFLDVLGRRLAEYKRRTSGDGFAVLYLDLDRFKVINDSLGHLAGDELLIAVSRRLESCLRQDDALGRLGGDEFAVLLSTVGDQSQANVIAFRIQDALRAPIPVGGREVFTSASIGIAFGHRDYGSPDEIMRDADTAMYHAKSNGKARHELFDAEMHARARDRHDLENDLRHALKSGDFEVHYQPIVQLTTGMCVGFESLVRWTRNGKPVSPALFVPVLEELGVIDELGTWVLDTACHTFADWQRRYPQAGLNCITVNASSRQLTDQNFPFLVHEAVRKSGLRVSDLRIEVTETALMDNPQAAAQVLSELRDYGVKIYLDDFGTGCSSLSHLHKLPVDALKIDRSFVMSLLLPDRPAIVESILALAHTLKTSVVAEGIESEIQARELERLGCTHAQGYLFSRPLAPHAAEGVIASNQPLGPKAKELADRGEFRQPWADVEPVGVAAGPSAATLLSKAPTIS
ncbi:MAG TPA: EAL domain-containing protein [Vicinamibacterales bacterium]|nr:EAL domain-containing protein [Vicinamibacterales bacterium]